MKQPDIRTTLARNLRAAAKRKGLALSAVADFAGVSRSQLYDVLARKKGASVDWLAKVSSALDVEPWQLLKRESSVGTARG